MATTRLAVILTQTDPYKEPIQVRSKPMHDEPVLTLPELLSHRLVRGVSIGQCVDGSPMPPDVYAHAHQYPKDSNRGWVCIRSPRDVLRRDSRQLSTTVMHEFAHLLAAAGHDDDWRRTMRELGQPIPAAYRKRKRAPRPRRNLVTRKASKR